MDQMTFSLFFQSLINGLNQGAIYALIALGYTMVYGIIRMINFAHGDFIMIGAYTLFYTIPLMVNAGMPAWLAVIVAIAVYLLRAPQLARLEVVGMAMVAGGAIGNAIDRLAFGFVTDFIATTFIDFPVFNVADIGITVGVVLALVGYMFLSPAAREVDATAELNARDEARAKRKAKQRGERARKIRERNER